MTIISLELLLLHILFLPHPSIPTITAPITIIHETAEDCMALSLACTTSNSGNKDHCLADSIKEHRTAFLANIIIIMVVGCIGNLLTLAALPYAWLYHRAKFPTLYTPIAVLIVHLSLCDLLYCILGLSLQVSILANGYFK